MPVAAKERWPRSRLWRPNFHGSWVGSLPEGKWCLCGRHHGDPNSFGVPLDDFLPRSGP
jgi:hypothetical protein